MMRSVFATEMLHASYSLLSTIRQLHMTHLSLGAILIDGEIFPMRLEMGTLEDQHCQVPKDPTLFLQESIFPERPVLEK